MNRLTVDSWLKAALVALVAFLVTASIARAGEVAAAPAHEVASAADPFTAFVAFLKASGPFGVAVLSGWWALRKDREKNEQAEKYEAQMKAMFEQVVGLVAAQTAANTKMEGTILALKDAILRTSGRPPRERDADVGG